MAVRNDIDCTWVRRATRGSHPENEYATFVMGRFRCNHGCVDSVWTSKKVAMVIRGYAGNGYNASVFNQRCRICENLGTFTLDKKSYIERIAYRLKKWAGVEIEPEIHVRKEGPPHLSDLCEGCKQKVCQG
ncbi:hypothetical protein CKAH01_10748 [Colletotrichum kahawae]|uniref:3CxxC-type domain-containing protein n=1 Tax=Colletotrichum kahawae TaxID=34407 RepID=A0AAD9XWE1_COLKA|nr:hypothetical protein CKAH01_10748 [Colletotrichum kahawae]